MKIRSILSLLLLVGISQLLFAQINEYTFDSEIYAQPTAIQYTESGKIIIGIQERSEVFLDLKPKVIVLSEIGEILWEYSDFAPLGRITEIILLEDQSFYVIGSGRAACDYGNLSFIYHFNEDGTILSNTSPDDNIMSPYAAALFPNGDIGIIGYNSFERRTSEYELVYKENTYFFEVIGFSDVAISGEDWIICGRPNNNNCSLMQVEVEGQGIDFWDYCHIEDDTIKQIIHEPWVVNPEVDFYYLMSSNAVFLLAGTNWTSSKSNEYTASNFTSMKLGEFVVYLLDDKGENSRIVALDKTTFEFVGSYDLQLQDNQKPIDFIVVDDQEVIIIGEHHSLHEDYQTIFETSEIDVFLKKMNLNGNNNYLNTDAGLSAIRLDNPPVFTDASCPTGVFECDVNLDVSYQDIFVTITNFGDEPLETVQVNARYDYCISCNFAICTPTQIFSRSYEDLSLTPGESKEVYFGDILAENQTNANHELCLWTSTPNNQIDKSAANDMACEVFSLTSVNESQSTEIEMRYVPIEQQLVLENSSLNTPSSGTITVYDILGRAVLQKTVSWTGSRIELPIDLSANLYIAVYRAKDSWVNLKFMNY